MKKLPKHGSSSSEAEERYATMDEKKRKRMISNRESARRSRLRREEHIKDLNCQITFFKNSNNGIIKKINSITQQFMAIESDNQKLATQRDELTKTLESLEIVSSYVKDIPQCNSHPWQLSHQSPPLVASGETDSQSPVTLIHEAQTDKEGGLTLKLWKNA
ncbi:hypothetical protein HYC85_012820 [Camellia sinensis]|uniref:BZIP domain-containing protein n=1 Tax=Camellia sinensis TaxID=4442 RepID=A0A7J7HE65_CAMSI|nr:hypothetical protein HYC85_012820 [Camellia sinensis]